jgi:hypothetical protein
MALTAEQGAVLLVGYNEVLAMRKGRTKGLV